MELAHSRGRAADNLLAMCDFVTSNPNVDSIYVSVQVFLLFWLISTSRVEKVKKKIEKVH